MLWYYNNRGYKKEIQNMRIVFTCKTNRNICAVNTAKFTLPTGTTITVDRTSTEWDIHSGILTMKWGCCYLWAIDGNTLFEEDVAYITDFDGFSDLIADAKLTLELEDDVDEGYEVEVIGWELEE